MEADINANIAHIGFNMLSDREVEVRCALNTNTVVRDKKCIDIITDAKVNPLPADIIDKIAILNNLNILHFIRQFQGSCKTAGFVKK